jgi:anti-sigma-K factor RskA
MSASGDPRDLFELYALGLLEEPDLSEVEALLASGSTEAKERIRRALENNAILMSAVPLADPPKRLRARVLAATTGHEARWKGMLGWAAASAALAVAVYLGVRTGNQQSELAQLRNQLRDTLEQSARTDFELTRVRQVLSFLNAADTRVVTFGPRDPKPPRGRVLINPARGVLLIASNLPPAPAGRIYEMWIIPKGGKPVAAGLFQTDAAGNALHLQDGAVAAGSAVAVTLEPESGSEQPTTSPLFVAAL